jgi:uncharacterized protein HemX
VIEDYSAARFWFDMVQLLGLAALGVYSWWRDREKVNSKRFKALEDEVKSLATQESLAELEAKRATRCEASAKRMSEAERSISTLSTEITHLPSRAELNRMTEGMTQLSQKLGRMEGRLDGINRAADLMNEFLISQGGRR